MWISGLRVSVLRPCIPIAVSLGFLIGANAWALPTGGEVVGGAATIKQPTAQTLHIEQTSDRALLNWQGFSIGSQETVQFLQPNAGSLAVNRVFGGDPSMILGNMLANGRVFLLNPNGVVFGPGSVVNVGGLLATTLSLQRYDLNKGEFSFAQDPTTALAAMVNQGTLRIADHGFVTLTAPGVVNEGLIVAKFGQVGLHAGTQMTVDFRGDGLIQYAVDGNVLGQVTDPNGKPLSSAVSNAGRIEADGGTVLLTAQASSAVLSSVINQTGVIQARRLEQQGGEIVLRGGDEGVVMVAGRLDATGETSGRGGTGATGGTSDVRVAESETGEKGERGGIITVRGEKIGLTDTARLDVSGDAGGGTITVGGGFQGKDRGPNAQQTVVWPGATLLANAMTQGDGGTVIVWADGTTQFGGVIGARGGLQGGNGGFAEVSGKEGLMFRGAVDLGAPLGNIGTLLLDPQNIFIQQFGQAYTPPYTFGTTDFLVSILDTGANSLSEAINAANVTLQANTDIYFLSANVTATTPGHGLTLQAGRTISLGSSVISLNGGAFVAKINDEGAVAPGGGTAQFMMSGGQILTNGGNVTIDVGTLGGTASGSISISSGNPPNIISSGAGNIAITGNGAPGILVSGTIIQSTTGSITLTGTGNGGIQVTGGSTIQSTTGSITLIGTGQSSSGGVSLSGPGTLITSMSGPIMINGTGTTGIELLSGMAVTSTGTASITLIGSGTTGPGISTSGSVNVIGGPSAAGDIILRAGTLSGTDSLTLSNLQIQGTGRLILEPLAAGDSIGIADGIGLLDIFSGELNLIQQGFSEIVIGRADGTGAVGFGSQEGSGYTFHDPVTIRSGLAGGAGSITVNGPLATTGTNSLTLEAGAQITVGVTGTLSTGTGALSLTADSLALNGSVDSVQGMGALLLQPRQATTSIGLGTDATGTFKLSDLELLRLKDGFSGITIGRSDGQHDIEIVGTTFRDPVTIRTPLGGGIGVDGLHGTGNASVTLIGSHATTTLDGDIVTDGQPITIDDSVIVAGGAGTTRTLDTTNGGATPAGADVTVTGTINAQNTAPANESLAVSAGTTGDVTLQNEIGGSKPLQNLSATGDVMSFPQTTLTGSLQATGSQGTFNGRVEVGPNGEINMVYPDGMFLFKDMISPNADLNAIGPITLMDDVVLDVGIGSLTLQNAVNAQTYHFTMRGNGIDLLGGAGSITGTGVVEIAPGAASTSMGLAGGAGTLQLTVSDLQALGIGSNNFSTVKLGRVDSTAAVTLGSYTFPYPLTIQVNAGSIMVTGTVVTSRAGDGITLLAGKSILVGQGASLTTNHGPLTLTANAGGTATGTFVGIDINGATLSSGTGALALTGTGGTSGASNYGVRLRNGAHVLTTDGTIHLTGTGGSGGTSLNVGVHLDGASTVTSESGAITLTGFGGTGTGASNRGVDLLGASVSSTTGPIDIHGAGGAGSSFSYGVVLAQGQVTSGGNLSLTGVGGAGGSSNVATLGMLITNASHVEGTGNATVALIGIGGNGTATSATNGEVGLFIHGQNGTFIRTVNGDLAINGTGHGTGIGGQGVIMRGGALVEATGSGNVLVTGAGSGTGSSNNNGIQMIEAGTTVRANTGNVTMTGTAHGALNSTNNIGLAIASGALVQKTGSGGTVTLTGTGGDGGGGTNNFGVALLSTPTHILANDGTILITGTGTNGAGGVTAQSGFLVGVPGIPCGSCAATTNLNAGGSGTITINSTP